MELSEELQKLLGIAKETGQQLVSNVKKSVQEVVESDNPLEVMGGRLAKNLQEMVPTEENPLGGFGLAGITSISKYNKLFQKEALERVVKDVKDPLSRSTITYMSPNDFLKLAYPREKTYRNLTPEQVKELGEEKRGPIREYLSKGGLSDIPKLFIHEGKVTGHEGRHRMDVFKEMGIREIPVEVRDSMYRWGQEIPPYKELLSETGEHTLPMPKSVVWESK